VAVASVGRGTAGGARQLLERAQQQWRSGNLGEAADLYQEVLRRHPRDPRVGLAALELGRLRMDHVGDLEGALVSFRRAVRQAGGAAVLEDALARLVEVSARLGYTAECAQARDNYLRRYPTGIHAATVTGRCSRPEVPRL
jgi:TolA-binding protein